MNDDKLNELRCSKCDKKLGANFSGEVAIVCPRCGHYNHFQFRMVDAYSKQTLDKIVKSV